MLSKFQVYHKLKPEIFWLSTEFSDDKRVETLNKSSKDIIKPYFLLTDVQQNFLKDIENKLITNCKPCSFYWNCDNNICAKYSQRETFMKDYNSNKRKFLKERIMNFLDELT